MGHVLPDAWVGAEWWIQVWGPNLKICFCQGSAYYAPWHPAVMGAHNSCGRDSSMSTMLWSLQKR